MKYNVKTIAIEIRRDLEYEIREDYLSYFFNVTLTTGIGKVDI